MKIHPNSTYTEGILTVYLQAQFTGDPSDIPDKSKIAAYGDPKVNLGGTWTDPVDPSFTFSTGSPSVTTGITTDLQNHPIQFMMVLPLPQPGKPSTGQGPLQVVTSDPIRAAKIWWDEVWHTRLVGAMNTLRALPPPTPSLPDAIL